MAKRRKRKPVPTEVEAAQEEGRYNIVIAVITTLGLIIVAIIGLFASSQPTTEPHIAENISIDTLTTQGESKYYWHTTGSASLEDCLGDDIGDPTHNSEIPEDPQCNRNVKGTVAVCWNGVDQQNASNKFNDPNRAWCTYKNVIREDCTYPASETKGKIWVCTEEE